MARESPLSTAGRTSKRAEADSLVGVLLADLDVGQLLGGHADPAAVGVGQPQHPGLAGHRLLDQAGDVVGRLVDLDHQLLGAVGDPELDLHMPLVLLVGLACAGTCGRPSVAPGRSSPAGPVPNSKAREPSAPQRGSETHPCCSPARSGPHRRRPRVPALPGRRGPALTGWGDLDPASLRIVRERLPGGGALGDGPDGLALARRRTTLLRSLCDAGRLTETEAGLLQLSPLGREFLDLPDAAQLGCVFAAWWEGSTGGTGRPRPSWGGC